MEFQYEESRSVRLENEVFFRVNPKYPQMGTQSICLILGGEIYGEGPGESHSFDISVDSIKTGSFIVKGVGFPLAPFEDTLRHCTEVWIPIQTGSAEEDIAQVRFAIKKRTSYRNWIYLWNYDSDNSASISGSWVVDGLSLGYEPYDSYSVDNRKWEELDYTCALTGGVDRSIIFVTYEPNNFRYNGTYNATLNNAMSESKQDLYTISGSEKIKEVISDYHKTQGVGGHSAGGIVIDKFTETEFNEWVRTKDFRIGFSASAERYGGDATLQTLDLAFTSFRAISASVYVDRISSGSNSASLEKVWEDIQEGNTDDPETVYFIPRCQLNDYPVYETDSAGRVVIDPETGDPIISYWETGSYIDFTHTTTVPTVGDLLFSVNQHTPVRYIEATLYAPFLNRVYRTDKFGAIVDEFPQSDFEHPEEE